MNSFARALFFVILVGAVLYGANKYGLLGDIGIPLGPPQKWGFIDRTGKVVIEPRFDAVAGCTILGGGTMGLRPTQCFQEGLSAVAIGRKWGFIDHTGKLVVPARYGFAGNFSDSLAVYSMADNGPFGYIDKTAREVIPAKFLMARDFHDGLAPASMDRVHFGYLDKSGAFAIPAQFISVDMFSDGLAWVRTATSSYYIDTAGKKVIEVPTSHIACPFSEGLACILAPQADEGYVVDKKGSVVFRFTGRCDAVKDGKLLCFGKNEGTIYDASGKKLATLAPEFRIQNQFSEGLCSAAVDEVTEPMTGSMWIKAGYINPSGQWAIRPAFYGPAQDFHEGLAAVTEWKEASGRRQYGFIDKTGRFAIAPRYGDAFPFSEGLAAVQMPVSK